MAVCDKCNQEKPDVGRVEVHVVAYDVVLPGSPTGTAEAAEACGACRPLVFGDLLAKVVAKFEHDVPAHKARLEAERLQALAADVEEPVAEE